MSDLDTPSFFGLREPRPSPLPPETREADALALIYSKALQLGPNKRLFDSTVARWWKVLSSEAQRFSRFLAIRAGAARPT